MQATFKNSKEFTKLIGIISVFDTSFILKCSKDGMRIFCLDGGKTQIIEAIMPVSYFTNYEFTCKRDTIELGINVAVFIDIIKGIHKNDVFHLIAKEDADKLHIQIDGEETQMVYDMKLMSVEVDDMEIPPMDQNIKMTIKDSVLKGWKTQICDRTGESIVFKVKKDQLEISSHGSNLSVNSTLCHGDRMCITIYDGPKDMTLSHKSIITAYRICDVASEIEYGWTNDAPAKFSCEFGSGGKIIMWFAPQMVDDEDEEMDDE